LQNEKAVHHRASPILGSEALKAVYHILVSKAFES
jgi:hypothetical protein